VVRKSLTQFAFNWLGKRQRSLLVSAKNFKVFLHERKVMYTKHDFINHNLINKYISLGRL